MTNLIKGMLKLKSLVPSAEVSFAFRKPFCDRLGYMPTQHIMNYNFACCKKAVTIERFIGSGMKETMILKELNEK